MSIAYECDKCGSVKSGKAPFTIGVLKLTYHEELRREVLDFCSASCASAWLAVDTIKQSKRTEK